MTIKEFIDFLPSRVDENAVAGENVLFHFDITGDEGGQHTVKVEDGNLSVHTGLEGAADCVVKMKDQHFTQLMNKDLNPMMAVLTGKLKISNQGLMMSWANKLGLM